MLTLEPLPKVITFDCYGTLVQWHRAVRDAARAALASRVGAEALEAQTTLLADAIRASAISHQQRAPYRRYATILRKSLDEALSAAGQTATEEDHRTLWATLSCIAPHPDTPVALARLRSRYRLAIISNTDDDLIAGTVDLLLSAPP